MELGSNEGRSKKELHKDVERRRREEMTALLGTLRSHIPEDFLEGKSSMCDQLKEATNYVTHQREKIQELREKRDRLRSAPEVVVRPCGDGSAIEVVIGGANESGICVADVVAILEESGLEVKSCSSSCSRQSSIRCLRCEVCEGKEIDTIDIQEKLRHLFLR
ncbi:transcription factor bHLH55 [Amborella trichopoda]|uniref:BHLH domain-containing protein n=1 Tax=Amborella trichopoda TaxID=13333 RepID=W1NMQ1_AMBTC|nr:transcription factor bHLH55 [Amborella trichopoda]ERM96555.1 hypothetical protein AMTR_s00001p00269160 [Amborella trichopoda]|eukprot:XP_006829139.1 transcription factor bHLH55 [Amborella trichopoda]